MCSYFQGEETTDVSTDTTQLQDINIATYLTQGPVPRPSLSRVDSDEARESDDESQDSRVLFTLEPPISASFANSFPRYLFVNANMSTFCQANTEDGSKLNVGNSTRLMEVFLPEVIQTEAEETVICEEDVEQVVEEDDSPADDGSQSVKYVKLCI